jgi:hypothetical protein
MPLLWSFSLNRDLPIIMYMLVDLKLLKTDNVPDRNEYVNVSVEVEIRKRDHSQYRKLNTIIIGLWAPAIIDFYNENVFKKDKFIKWLIINRRNGGRTDQS